MADKTPKLTPENIKAEDLIGVYQIKKNTLTSKDGREYTICHQRGLSRKAPALYLACESGHISGLFYVKQNHYTLSAKSDGVKLSLFMKPDNVVEIERYTEPTWLAYKGAK